jgi:hypothetical protein
MMDSHTIIRNDDQKTLKAWKETAPSPSTRCKGILKVAGIELHQLPSNPRYPKSVAEYDAMIERIWSA